jgi:hypothetical protein
VTVTNSGKADLAITSALMGGTNSGDFATSADLCTGATLTPAPGSTSTCTINVTFTPTATGSRSASLNFTDNAFNSPQAVTLTGTGTAPVAGASPPSLTFGNQNLGTTSASQPVTLSNTTGTAALNITSIGISANFGESDNCGGSVAIGGSCTINVTFSPSLTATAGPLNGALTITDNSNGVAGSMQTVSLSGTATSSGGGGGGGASPPPPVGVTDNETITALDTPLVVTMPPLLTDVAPVAYYSVGSLGFQGQSGTLPLTVSNLGQANLSLDAVSSPASPFSIVAIACTNGATSLPTTLPSAGACVFSISYVAPASGTPTGTITFTDNAALSNVTSTAAASNFTQSIPLSGAGTSMPPSAVPQAIASVNETITAQDTPLVVAMPALLTDVAPVAYYSVGSLGFGGQSQTLPFSVSNLGQANLSLDAVSSPASPFSIVAIACTNGATSLPTTLPSAGACVLSISYVAPPSGTPTSTITFTDNAALSNVTSTASGSNFTQSIALSGAGTSTAPPSPPATTESVPPVNETITVVDNPVVVAMPALLTITAPVAYYSVGSLGFQGQSGTLPLTVSNLGQANLSLDAVTSPASPFSIAQIECTNGATSLPATLPSAGACIFSISYVAPSSGTPAGTITFTDNAALSNVTSTASGSNFTQSIALSGAGTSTASPSPPSTTVSVSVNEIIKVTDTEAITLPPALSVAPSSLSFPTQIVGVSSPTQTVTLTNTGGASVTISSITASGDFSQTNTCGTTISVGANCTVSVTFKPTAGGTRTGSLSISNSGFGSPESVALSGTGLDFTLTVSSGSTTSATVTPGQPAIYNFSVGGLGGLSGTVSFTCTGLPYESTCTVAPNPATLGSSATNVTVTVTTTAPAVGTPRSRPLSPVLPLSPDLRYLLMLAVVLMAMAWAVRRWKQVGVSRWPSTLIPLAAGLLLALALAGCHTGGTPNIAGQGTPAASYTLTVTGTTGSGSSAISHSMNFTLIVS